MDGGMALWGVCDVWGMGITCVLGVKMVFLCPRRPGVTHVLSRSPGEGSGHLICQ